MKCHCILLWLLFGCLACVQARPPLVVILVPGTSLQDWRTAQAPNLHRLMAAGALAVMNTRTTRLPNDHRRETPESAVLTLGAGARAAGSPDSLDFLPPSAPVVGMRTTTGELYQRRTGQMPGAGRYVNVHWPAVLRANTGMGYDLRLGNLAGALASRQAHLVSSGGFADGVVAGSDGTVSRQSSLMARDGNCLVWDAGSNLALADRMIGEAARQVTDRQGRLIVLSPFAGDEDYTQQRRLTPVLEWGPDVPAGLLRSSTTHRAGLVANTDFAPTVGACFGITPEQFPVLPFGHAWSVIPAPHAERQVSALQEQAVRQAHGMAILPYLAIALALWMLGGAGLARLQRLPDFWPIVPLALINALLFGSSSLSFFLGFVLLFLSAWIFAKRLGTGPAAAILLALTAVSLITDMLTGSRLMQQGLLGYSAIEGARYYGIGNEAMGALIGASLVLAARFWPRLGSKRWIVLILLASVSLLLGSVGAKAGGLLVSLAAFGALGFVLLGGRWSPRIALGLAGGVIAAMTLAAAGDAVWGLGSHSHIGEAARRIQSGGLPEAWNIIERKLAVESRLAYHSAWACTLWGGLLSLSLLRRSTDSITPETRALRTGGAVAIAGCILFNDAGIVAGALCLVPIWCNALLTSTNNKPLDSQRRVQGATGP